MNNQLSFLDASIADAKFAEFNSNNPQVYRALVKFAWEARTAGHYKISIELLVNRVRWELIITTQDRNSEFKINNNYKSRYARMIMTEPGLENIFNTREMRS